MLSSSSSSLQIIIPFRGSLDHLEDCVKQCRLYSPKNANILVFDDRSTFVEKPDFLTENEYFPTGGVGLPQVVEFSKKFISADFVAIMAGDDIPAPNRFNLQLDLLSSQSLDLSIGRQEKFKQKNSRVPALAGSFLGDVFDSSILLLGAYGADGTIMMTSTFYREKYILDATDSFSDWSLALCQYPHSKISYTNKILVYYRQHSGQVTRNKRNLWIESKVKNHWLALLSELTDINWVSQAALNVIAAPWYRSDVNKEEIDEALEILNKIIESYEKNNLDRITIASIEKIIIRRLIFRMNFANAFFLLKRLRTLDISNVYRKTLFESLTLCYEFIRSIGNAPRIINPPAG